MFNSYSSESDDDEESDISPEIALIFLLIFSMLSEITLNSVSAYARGNISLAMDFGQGYMGKPPFRPRLIGSYQVDTFLARLFFTAVIVVLANVYTALVTKQADRQELLVGQSKFKFCGIIVSEREREREREIYSILRF